MNKEEAYKSMEQGNKITHWLFSDEEFFYMDGDDNIRDENKYYLDEGWEIRKGDNWETGWSIYKK